MKIPKASLILLSVILADCSRTEVYVPKPHAYPRIQLPEIGYRPFDSAGIPYAFEIPMYAAMQKDTPNVYTRQPYWFNLNFMPFDATLHLTYYRFNDRIQFDSLIEDSRKLVNKHIQRAEDIIEEPIYNAGNVKGMLFEIEGNTATNLNFYLTDSSRNFIRGALYFNSKAASDSTAPVFERMKTDVSHLIKTFRWK
ncbi:MAG: gliding motility lipoprotein GldD [Bacteroidetes bacterium]|nr:gliding motility lipoprotein GldD [Bacteroidota bacterium]